MPLVYLITLILAVLLLPGCDSQHEAEQKAPPAPVAAPPPAAAETPAPAEPAAQTPSSTEIVARARLAVVLVRTPKTQGVGFLVNPDGIVATAYQLVKDANVVGVRLASGDIYPATEIYAHDPLKNLALLRISGYKLPVLELQDSDQAAAGQEVIVVTDPAGAGTMVSATIAAVSDISALDSKRRGHQLLRLQAPLPPASNGAPVLDAQGKVLGLTASFGKQSVAVPSNYIAGLLNNPQPIALMPGGEPPEKLLPPPGTPPAAAQSEPAAPPPPATPPAKAETARAAPAKPKPPQPPPVAQSMREVKRMYVALADGGQIRTDRAAGPAICKPKIEEALQEENFVIAQSPARADAVLRLSGTHKTGCTMPLGCGREIMQYRAHLTNREGDTLWQTSGNESAVGFEEVCRDLAEDLAESISEARER